MHLISAVIITFNEEANLGRCLDSVSRVADEIIVLDAFSTDRTVEIAKSKGAIVKQRYFTGYIRQKNTAISFASHDYILSLDADEALDDTLAAAIIREKENFTSNAYAMNRCTNYCGKFIRYGSWYPDTKLRLFNKHVARWNGIDPHDRIELSAKFRVVHLRGEILHYSFPTVEEHLRKNNRYSAITAKVLHSRGKKSNWFKIVVNPFWTFIHGYVIRLGWLNGYHGFLISSISAHGTFLKYIRLYEMQKGRGESEPIVQNPPVIITTQKERTAAR